MARITLTIKTTVHNALWELADREHRDPRAQGALLIEHELERQGLLPADSPTIQSAPTSAKLAGLLKLQDARP